MTQDTDSDRLIHQLKEENPNITQDELAKHLGRDITRLFQDMRAQKPSVKNTAKHYRST